jgi:hypothetical protein
MPTPINRESLSKKLVDRYKTQHVGGAFDAAKIPNKAEEISINDGVSVNGQAYTIDQGGFRSYTPVGLSNFADLTSRDGGTSKGLSANVKGLSTQKYAP